MVDLRELLAKLILSLPYSDFIRVCKDNDIQPQEVLDLLESNGFSRL